MQQVGLSCSYGNIKLNEAGIAESLLVVTLRLWVLDRTLADNRALPDWRGGLCAIGLEHLAGDVVAPLFEFLYGNLYGVEVMPLHCVRISTEERSFLTCVSLMQEQRPGELKRILSSYTFPATARVVVPLIARLAAGLEDAGMVLPAPDPKPTRRPLRLPVATVH